MKQFLYISKCLVDAESIYKLPSLDNCDILHLLISDWSSITLMQVSHPHAILFLSLIGFIVFVMYFLSDIYLTQIFPSIVLAPVKISSELGNIVSLCSSLTDIWSRCCCFFTILTFILTNTESSPVGECITWGWFSIQACNSLICFSEKKFQ